MATTVNQLVTQARVHLQEELALITPGSPLVSPQGTPGASTVTYALVALNALGHSAASAVGSTSTAAAVLNGTNFNRLTWTKVSGATGYKVYRVSGGATQGLISTLGDVATLDDTGLAGDGATAPTDNTSGVEGIYFNTDDLIDLAIKGFRDMWRAFVDLHMDHFATVDETNVSLAGSSSALTGVPADCFRILLIEPRDTSDASSNRNLRFQPTMFKSPNMIAARARSSIDPGSGGTILYAILNAGSPVAAPTVKTAPQVSSTVLLRFVYIATLSSALSGTSNNPIPGESDNAIVAWIVAFALAKDREDRSPDPDWIAIYATEKKSILAACAPRQEQEARYVKGVFDDYDEEEM